MGEEQLSCRFRHLSSTTPSAPAYCLNARVYTKDRLVDREMCSLCDKRAPHLPSEAKPISWSRFDTTYEETHCAQRNCLLVLQPRCIPRCLESIERLPVDKVYFRAYTECQLVVPLNDFIRQTNYDNYILVADDVIVTGAAYEAVASLLKRHEMATGYCRLSQDSPYVNVTRGPLRLANGKYAILSDYDFYHIDELSQYQNDTFLSWFGGWALTGMRRDIWLDFPFRVNYYTGAQSDFESSWLLNIPFVCHRASYIEHLKPAVNRECVENVLVGKEPPRTEFREYLGD